MGQRRWLGFGWWVRRRRIFIRRRRRRLFRGRRIVRRRRRFGKLVNPKQAQRLSLILLLAILASPTLAAEPKFPPLTGRVVDNAGVLSASTQSELTDMLAAHERATGEQVVVVTLPSLQGYTIEDYGYQLGRYWGIG
jgi:hypothetical protein